MKRRSILKSHILAMLLLAPVFAHAKTAPPAPQTFEISPGCSITNSDLVGQFKQAGLLKGWTKSDITWDATWLSTGCTFPFLVSAYFDYIDGNNAVAFSARWDIEVKKGKFKPGGVVEKDQKIVNQVQSIRLAKIQLITKAQLGHSSGGLIGQSSSAVRTTIGEPLHIDGARWTYTTNTGSQLYLYISDDGTVTDAKPADLPLDEIDRR